MSLSNYQGAEGILNQYECVAQQIFNYYSCHQLSSGTIIKTGKKDLHYYRLPHLIEHQGDLNRNFVLQVKVSIVDKSLAGYY